MSYSSWDDIFPGYQSPPPPPQAPDEAVGKPEDSGGWGDIAGPGADRAVWGNAPPDVGPKAPDEQVGQQDASKKRPGMFEPGFESGAISGANLVSQAISEQPAPSPPPDESVGVPEQTGPAAADESVGKKDGGGFGGWLRDLPGNIGNAIPGVGVVREVAGDVPAIVKGKMNPLDMFANAAKAEGRTLLKDVGYVSDTSNRVQGVVANQLNQWGGDVKSGDWGALGKDVVTLPWEGGIKNLPYIASGEQANLSPTDYATKEVLSKNWLGAVVPTEGGSGEGPKIPHTGINLYDTPIVGGVARVAGAVGGIPGALDEGPSIDVNALRRDLSNGMSIPDALKAYGGNEGTAIASQFLTPASFIDLPGVGEFTNAIHGIGLGTVDSAASRLTREIFSPGSLAKVDARAADAVAAKYAGSARPDVVAQALADRANAPAYGKIDAIKDLFAGRTPGIADQDARILDHSINTFKNDYAAVGNQNFPALQDYIQHALTPDAKGVAAKMAADGVITPDELAQLRSVPSRTAGAAPSLTHADPAVLDRMRNAAPAYAGNWARDVIAGAAKESLGTAGVQDATAGMMKRMGDYLRTGEYVPQSALGRSVNDVRQALASDVKAGLLAFSPRYYMQNIADNVAHAMFDGGYGRFTNTFTRGQEDAVSGLSGIRGTSHVPDFFKNEYGVTVDTGQTLARTAREESAQRATATAGQRAGLGDVLRLPAQIAGKPLETIGDFVENLPRQSLYSRLFFSKIDPAYRGLAGEITNDVLTHPSADIQQIGQQMIDGLRSGDATSFQKASRILADATVSDPADQAMLNNLRRTLPNRIDEINKAAAADAYQGVQKVFNNYDLHIKYFDTLMNAIFLFNKYQTRQPLYLAAQALQHPGLFSAQVNANQAMRDWNAQNRPGTRGSTQERLWFGKFGVNPLDVFPWDKMYNAIKGQGNQSDQNTFGLRQDRLSKLARGFMDAAGTVGLGTPALPAQLLGERANVLPPSLANVTDQPFIHGLKTMLPDVNVPRFNLPGVSVAGQPVTLGGGTVNPGAVIGNALSPSAFIEHAINTVTGRQPNTDLTDYYTGVMLSDMVRNNPNADMNEYRRQWENKSGPLYEQAHQQAIAYQQQSRDFNAMIPTSTSVELPGEQDLGMRKANTQGAVGRAQADVQQTGRDYQDAIYTRDPVKIESARRASDSAAERLKAAHDYSDRLNLFSTGPALGHQVDENGNELPYLLPEVPNAISMMIGDQKMLRDQYQANPYTPANAALADQQRAAAKQYGESTLFPQFQPKNATERQTTDAFQQQQANIMRNSIDQGTFLNPADRKQWLDYKANEKRLGDVIAGTDADGKALKVSDLIDPLTRDRARALAIGDQKGADAATAKIDALQKSNPAVDTYQKGTDASFAANGMRRLNALRDAAIGSPDVQTGLDPLRGVNEYVTKDGTRLMSNPLEGYTPRGSQSALTDRWLFTEADPAVRQALVDRQNLTDDYWRNNSGARSTYDAYNKINDLNEKDAYLKAHPDLQRTLTDLRGIDARIATDDRVPPALANLREQEFMRGHPEWGFRQDSLWDTGRLQRDQLLYEGMNDAQRASYAAYGDFTKGAVAERYFQLLNEAPKKGDADYTSWWRANGDTYSAARSAYNNGLDAIQKQTGADPRAVSNQLRQAQGLPVSESSGTTSATSGGGGTYRSTGGSSSGGYTRRSSSGGGSSGAALAIAGRDSFYNVFDNLSSREKAALHDVDSLDKVFTRGSRPSAQEWGDALRTMNQQLPTIRETQGLRDQYYALFDNLSSRDKSALRDITGRVANLKASADTLRGALTDARARLASGTSDTYSSGYGGSGGSGGGQRLLTASDIMRYGGYGPPGASVQRDADGTVTIRQPTNSNRTTSSQSYSPTTNSQAARTSYSFRSTPSRTSYTTTKKKVA